MGPGSQASWPEWYNSHITCASASILERARASERIPGVALGSKRRKSLFTKPYWLDQRSDVPEQYLAVGWVRDRLYSVIFEAREDEEGEILHLVPVEIDEGGNPTV